MRHYFIISFLCITVTMVYNSFADEWYQAAPLNISRGGAAAVMLEGHIYVFGGKSINNRILKNVERYDPVYDVWDTTHVPDFSHARFNATAVIFNEKIYLIGGQNGERVLKEVEVYDPVQNTWDQVQDLRRDREGLSGAVFNDRIYAIGGQKDPYNLIHEIEWYDQPADNWLEAIFNLPYPRSAHYHGVIGNDFYMFGGFYYDPTNTAYKASPGVSGYEWTQLEYLSKKRAYGASVISRGNIYIIGGETTYGKTSTVEVFLTESETYGPCEPITSPRSGMAAVTIEDTIIFVIGGFESENNDPVTTVEWYHGECYTALDYEQNKMLPEDHVIINGYPNPFNNGIRLDISIPERDNYKLDIYAITGQKIKTLYQGFMNSGNHSYKWQVNPQFSSGLYFLFVRSEKYLQKYKMIYIK